MGKKPSVVKVGEDRYQVEPYLISSATVEEYQGEQYLIDQVPGVSSKDSIGAAIEYHQQGTFEVPQLMIDKGVFFHIVQRNDYGVDGTIVERVRDVALVKDVLDHLVTTTYRSVYETEEVTSTRPKY